MFFTRGAGCYGMNGHDDVAAEAALLRVSHLPRIALRAVYIGVEIACLKCILFTSICAQCIEGFRSQPFDVFDMVMQSRPLRPI